jgi:hypothetical protein
MGFKTLHFPPCEGAILTDKGWEYTDPKSGLNELLVSLSASTVATIRDSTVPSQKEKNRARMKNARAALAAKKAREKQTDK